MTIQELSRRSAVPVRTVRYYIGEGLLPSAEGRGRAASYTQDHLLRLEVIRKLVELRVPLSDIRGQLGSLSTPELQRMLAEERRRSAGEEQARARSPRDYVSSLLTRAHAERSPDGLESPAPVQQAQGGETWRRFVLAPGVELHVSAAAQRRERDLIEVLRVAARSEQATGGGDS